MPTKPKFGTTLHPAKSENTTLNDDDEKQFQRDFAETARAIGIDPNPDDPRHQYDYRGAWKAGYRKPEDLKIDPEDQRPHWPSKFKHKSHPTRFKDGRDTRED